MKRRILSILLALSLCLTLLPTMVLADSDEGSDETGTTTGNWADFANTDWYNTTETAFTLTTAAELAGLAKLVNEGVDDSGPVTFSGKTITLGDSIDLSSQSWTPIGKYTNGLDDPAFQGTFDGNNNTVSGLCVNITENSTTYTSGGLFGYVGSGGTVKTLPSAAQLQPRFMTLPQMTPIPTPLPAVWWAIMPARWMVVPSSAAAFPLNAATKARMPS